MLLIYQFMSCVRLTVLLCHFVYGKRFWRRVKRCCSCLNTVEYEQRVDFQIYDARDYVEKVNSHLAQEQEGGLEV